MNNLGKKIKEERIKKGLTQQEFADLLYVSDKTISSYECGRTIPDINTLFKISSILDVNLYSLIDTNINNLNNLEIEVKLKVSMQEFNRIKNIIKKDDSSISKCNITDYYYVPTYKEFNNEWLRIRNENNKYILTYKKKIINNCCEEFEVLINNFSNFETILKSLDFKMKGSIIKTREKIIYNDKYEFSFDNVENIGDFIEVEVKKIESDNVTEIKTLMKLLENLKIDLNSIESKRYFDYL